MKVPTHKSITATLARPGAGSRCSKSLMPCQYIAELGEPDTPAPDDGLGISGQATEIGIQAREILRIREVMNKIQASPGRSTGFPMARMGEANQAWHRVSMCTSLTRRTHFAEGKRCKLGFVYAVA
jgi:hypothetical protein